MTGSKWLISLRCHKLMKMGHSHILEVCTEYLWSSVLPGSLLSQEPAQKPTIRADATFGDAGGAAQEAGFNCFVPRVAEERLWQLACSWFGGKCGLHSGAKEGICLVEMAYKREQESHVWSLVFVSAMKNSFKEKIWLDWGSGSSAA
jgi:hypothetical protein